MSKVIKYTSKEGNFTSTYCLGCWKYTLQHMPSIPENSEDESFEEVGGNSADCEYRHTHEMTAKGKAVFESYHRED